MKNFALIAVHFACAVLLFAAACSGNAQSRLKGNWLAKDGSTRLKITDNEFIAGNDSPVPEEYIIKGDTIYTSFQGNQPYTKFVIQHLDEHQLKLLYPDSVSIEFAR